ncbi:MAG TPA: hypothetical protein VN612_04640 [Acidobacteriaceae bacterium]|nr:hypothetical protein [Acidobacteriaceae bacterium]
MRIYRALTAHREDWGGKLLLLVGPGSAQTGVAPAVGIAAGTTLVLDSDAAAMKSAMRAGQLDFLVNSLDEALRALKNEIRQKRALSVGLIAKVTVTLTEMEQRGIAPDLRLDSASLPRGPGSGEQYFTAFDAAALRAVDAALFGILPASDLVRSRWLQRAPQFLREARRGGRWIWLTERELTSLASQGITPVSRA